MKKKKNIYIKKYFQLINYIHILTFIYFFIKKCCISIKQFYLIKKMFNLRDLFIFQIIIFFKIKKNLFKILFYDYIQINTKI
jgi:hypothetical protein